MIGSGRWPVPGVYREQLCRWAEDSPLTAIRCALCWPSVAIFTLEQRFYTDWFPLRLFRVGATAFVDVGRAWGVYRGPEADLGLLSDVGVGLRIGSSRSSRGSMLHVDVAYPLQGPPDIRHLQFVIETGTSF